LGVIMKEGSYNKMIGKLSEELHLLFIMNKLDVKAIENLKLPTVDDLFEELLKKSNKKEKDYPDAELLQQFSKHMLGRYSFDRKDRWERNENILQRRAVINRRMYEWAMENIIL
jgi:hypothetical protein